MTTTMVEAKVQDPDDGAWHHEARQRWAEAELADPETPFTAYIAPALPDWSARAPAHVTRKLLGRFLQDRDSRRRRRFSPGWPRHVA